MAVIYQAAAWILVKAQCRERAVRAIYAVGAEKELLYGASDLDFLVVIRSLHATEEMQFLHRFWGRYRRLKRIFPMLGEVWLVDEHEAAGWRTRNPGHITLQTPRHLSGDHCLPPIAPLTPRQKFSSGAKAYWEMLEPLLREEGNSTWREKLAFRRGAKAAVDFFRVEQGNFSPRMSFCREPSSQLAQIAPALHLLPVPREALREIAWQAFLRLEQWAGQLPPGEVPLQALRCAAASARQKSAPAPYALTLLELFKERLLLRHPAISAIYSYEENGQVFLALAEKTSRADWEKILRDFEDSRKLLQACLPLPLGPESFAQLEISPFLDHPFHGLQARQAMHRKEKRIYSSGYELAEKNFPKDFGAAAHGSASLALRLQPPPDFDFLLEQIFGRVLQLRHARETGELPLTFFSALAAYQREHPLRGQYALSHVGRYHYLYDPQEEDFWAATQENLRQFGEKNHARAAQIEAQLAEAKSRRLDRDYKLMRATTDLWIEMVPFFRLELNAQREHHESGGSVMRV